jgi:hypothetical protein
MRCARLASLSLAAVVSMAGCATSNNSGAGTGGATTPNAFSGQYAFLLSGFDSAGNPMGISGSLKADGLGHITGGEADLNDNGRLSSDNALAGTYAFDPDGQGALGSITLTNTLGAPHALNFGFSLQTSGAFGQIMSLDANNFIAAGTMQLQSPSAFTLAGLAGDYIVSINGRNATHPTSTLGRLSLGSAGATTNLAFDRSEAGVGSATSTTPIATFGTTGPDTNGRGTFTLTLNDTFGITTQNFAYYVVSAKRLIAVETDTTGTMTADFSQQSTPFTAATAVTPGSVFGIDGINTTAANNIVAVGQLQMTAAPNTASFNWDSNDAGVIAGPITLASQPVVFDATTGRGTVTIANGTANGLADTAVFYLTAPGAGFMMDATAGITNRAAAGTLTAQAAGPYSATADLGGLGIVRSRGSSVNNAFSLIGLFGLSTNMTTYALLFDNRFPGSGGVITTQLDASVPGIGLQTLDGTTGRGILTIPDGTSTETEAFYVIGPNQFVFIDISPVSSGANIASTLFFVNPH